MLRDEFITKIQNLIEINVTKKDLNIIINGITDVIKEAVLAGDYVTIPEICKISSRDVAAKSGVTKLHGGETTWEKPAHKEAFVKVLPSFKRIFEGR